jgi:hypothetical protein
MSIKALRKDQPAAIGPTVLLSISPLSGAPAGSSEQFTV